MTSTENDITNGDGRFQISLKIKKEKKSSI